MQARLLAFAERHWRLVVLLAWLAMAGLMVSRHWARIEGFGLADTDDNMRISQVRALLNGQDWYDLRQHKLDGSNIHWSRLVDLPIAGLILAARLFVTGAQAEKFAVAVAPLLPYLLLGIATSLTARRLIHPLAYVGVLVALFFAGSTNGMFVPTRIDHHGWQLALLALAVSGIADPRPARGGATLGIASACSLAIGLEMLIYLALLGGATVLLWVGYRAQRPRLQTYAAALAGGTAIAFLLFASDANRAAVCDALSPVWLADALLGGALMFLLALWTPGDWRRRLAAAAAAGAVLAAFHALAWPHCLARLEGVSDELYRLWLSHVREARPIYRHGWRTTVLVTALPLLGAVGWLAWGWRHRRDGERLGRILGAALPAVAAGLLLLWQTRAGPAAQLLAIPGAVALAWWLAPLAWRSSSAVVRVAGAGLIVLLASGGLVPMIVDQFPAKPKTERQKRIDTANRRCPTLAALRPIALLPRGKVFTFVDLSPRLITVTHHSAIAGPYHRNGAAMLDVQHAFRGSAEQARRIIARHRADYLLICPDMGESTIYLSEAKNGFYGQLVRGQVPGWLERVPLPADSPYRMWRVRPAAAASPSP